MARPLLLVFATLALALAALPADGQAPSGAWTGTLLAGDLALPVDIVFGPDGTLYYAELDSGNVRAIPPGASAPLPDPLAHVDSVRSENGGFLGLALDPDFANTRAFFVYYSMEKAGATNGQVNRVSRLDASGERVLLDDIPYFERHNGGRLVFTGPDTLVVATGDNELRAPSQDPESILGKTLRMTREGAPAPDNPDPTSLVYTLGHRNMFGLAYDAASGTLWSTENGPQHNDEVNILRAGENYGWPTVAGIANHPDYVDPVIEYETTIGPTGGTVLDGDFYFGAFNDGKVRRISRDASGAYVETIAWDEVKPALDVEAGPDGRLYFASFDAIYVLTPPGAEPPPIATPTAVPASSPTPSGPTTGTPTGAPSPDETTTGAKIPALGALLGLAALIAALAIRPRR